MKQIGKTLLVTVAFGLLSLSASATTINFNLPIGTLGHSHIYTSGSTSVTAYAFGSANGKDLLFGKNDSATEHGIGISGNKDNEITTTSFVQLDITQITGLFSLGIGSTQNNEGFIVCFSNTLGTLGTTCTTFNTPGSDPFTTPQFNKGANQFVSVTSAGTPTAQGNILLDQINFTPTPVPEPSSLYLLGTGILGAAGLVRRKLSA